MKVFVFSPSNQCIGKFDISDFEGITPAVESFIRTHPETKRLSYVECGPRVWTITNVSPFELQEGVVEEKPLPPSLGTNLAPAPIPINPIDKQFLDSQVGSVRTAYVFRFCIDLAVGVAIAVLITKESFGQNNQIACLITIVYAQLAAILRTGNLQAESNSDKLDIVKGGESNAARELWDRLWIAQNDTRLRFFYLYCVLHLSLIATAFWRLLA
jgi:hypothetical protein